MKSRIKNVALSSKCMLSVYKILTHPACPRSHFILPSQVHRCVWSGGVWLPSSRDEILVWIESHFIVTTFDISLFIWSLIFSTLAIIGYLISVFYVSDVGLWPFSKFVKRNLFCYLYSFCILLLSQANFVLLNRENLAMLFVDLFPAPLWLVC